MNRFLVAGASIVLSSSAWAQVPAGPTFRVNDYTTGRQVYPSVAVEPDGDFVVVWDHSQQYPQPWDVSSRRFSAGGVAMGGDFTVNAYTTGYQTTQAARAVSLDARGNAVIAWSDNRNFYNVFVRRVSAAAAPLGPEFMARSSGYGFQFLDSVAVAPDGRFVVVWHDTVSTFSQSDVVARRFDAAGSGLGLEFRVNTFTTGDQLWGDVAMDEAGNFTVVWQSDGQDGPLQAGIFGQRFDAAGLRLGGEFQVNTYSTGHQRVPVIAATRDGAAIVAWGGVGPGAAGEQIWARRYSSTGVPQGVEFSVSAAPVSHVVGSAGVAMDEPGNFVISWAQYTETQEVLLKMRRFAAGGASRGSELQFAQAGPLVAAIPAIGSDAVGNLVVAWADFGPNDREVFGRRFGGLRPVGLTVDRLVTKTSDGNEVLESGEQAHFDPSWRNVSDAPITFSATIAGFTGPAGPVYSILDGVSNYPTLASGATGSSDLYTIGVAAPGGRPAQHWDASLVEAISPDAQGQRKRWPIHIGESFTDVPRFGGFYPFVETLFHRGITGGCASNVYCPTGSTTREQMSVFVLVAKEGAGYLPPACTTPVFGDVPPSSPFCRWIEELARRGVTGGCGGGDFCPTAVVSREQMAVFLLRTLDPALNPPACATPMFNDVPASSPYCPWIEELARRGITGGCGGGNYCPTAAVTREQMAVFLTGTFGLTLYGP